MGDQVGAGVVPHDRASVHVVRPHAETPVADGEKIFTEGRVTLNVSHGTVMTRELGGNDVTMGLKMIFEKHILLK